MKKKTLIIVIAALVVAALAAGIYFATRPKVEEKASLEEITILYPGEETDAFANFINGPFAEKVKNELNMKVNFRFLSWDAYWDQKKVMLAAKEPIDLYWDGLPDLSTMVNNKEAQPLDDLIAKCWPSSATLPSRT